MQKPTMVGINHVALAVGDIERALSFYGNIFEFSLRHKDNMHAFIDMGDQFLALMKTENHNKDDVRHFGLVVDDIEKVRALAKKVGAELLEGPYLDFLDPWGNRVQVVSYEEVQFTKSQEVLEQMGLNFKTP